MASNQDQQSQWGWETFLISWFFSWCNPGAVWHSRWVFLQLCCMYIGSSIIIFTSFIHRQLLGSHSSTVKAVKFDRASIYFVLHSSGSLPYHDFFCTYCCLSESSSCCSLGFYAEKDHLRLHWSRACCIFFCHTLSSAVKCLRWSLVACIRWKQVCYDFLFLLLYFWVPLHTFYSVYCWSVGHTRDI